MDFKGITWVGNIYQKFEAMCLEVDDIICQDTVKYVENQVQTVGDTVKKFCSDVMQDLIPPSAVEPVKGAATPGLSLDTVEPVKGAAAPDLSLEQNADVRTCKKSTVGIREDPTVVGIEESPIGSNVNVPVEDELRPACATSFVELHSLNLPNPSSLEPAELANSESPLRQTDDIGICKMSKADFRENPINAKLLPFDTPAVIAPVKKDLSGASLFDGSMQNNNHLECGKLSNLLTPASAKVASCNSTKKVGKILDNHVDKIDSDPDISGNNVVLPVVSGDDKVVDSGIALHTGDLPFGSNGADTSISTYASAGSSSSTANEAVTIFECAANGNDQFSEPAKLGLFISTPDNARSDDPDAESEPDDKVKLEESCVMVDSNELSYVSSCLAKHKSYKKKIRDAFASKMRLARKQDKEQLAIWYTSDDDDYDAGSNQQRVGSFTSSTFTRNSGAEKLRMHDICESDWELL